MTHEALESLRITEHLRCGIENELRADSEVVAAGITVTVTGDRVTLTGIVRTPSERAAVLAAVRRIAGMRQVHDMVAMRHSNEGDQLRRVVHEAIRRSFHRTADLDTANVGVVCEFGRVWLSGRVQSLAARTSAENAAWAIPGVKVVDNDLRVGSYGPTIGSEIDDRPLTSGRVRTAAVSDRPGRSPRAAR